MEAAKKEEETYGCQHYKRSCAFVSPCCKNVYTCRLCHDDKEDHAINRKEVMEIECLKCQSKQPIGPSCIDCGVTFGRYFCASCRLYDDDDKNQFHCDGCGICRIGGRENFFHCDKCDMCLTITMKDSHKCVEKASHSNCPVCMDYLHTSRDPCQIPPCGHLLHVACYRGMLKTGNYACALCGQSMQDMGDYWKSIADEIENTPMPEEYRNLKVSVLCRDCHQTTRTLFHICGLKCMNCSSYNTARAAEPEEPAEDAACATPGGASAATADASVEETDRSDDI